MRQAGLIDGVKARRTGEGDHRRWPQHLGCVPQGEQEPARGHPERDRSFAMARLRGFGAEIGVREDGTESVAVVRCGAPGAGCSFGAGAANELPTEPMLRINAPGHIGELNYIATDAKERFAATTSDDKTVRVWSLPDGKLQRTIWLPSGSATRARPMPWRCHRTARRSPSAGGRDRPEMTSI